MRQFLNWKTYFIVVALAIVTATLFYTNLLAGKLAEDEKIKVEQYVEGLKVLSQSTDPIASEYILRFTSQNNTIPIILTNESDSILDYKNIDSLRLNRSKNYLKNELASFKSEHGPIVVDFGFGLQKLYYGDSYLLTQLKYFPYVQLVIILLFLVVILMALSAANKSLQNQVWVGLSKETAHQLGTPLTSMEGWIELLADDENNRDAVTEMRKDLSRLKLVADRFGKVGSDPELMEEDLVPRIQNMVDYMQKRAPAKVKFSFSTNEAEIPVYINGPLFDWVMENLMRNALDAMDGQGNISIEVENQPQVVKVNVCDTGKGIPKHLIKKVFDPGFTTKKRGWGLGLSLAKRIINKYHHGSLYVKGSEVGKGTTFRILLRR
ncbi:MAG TPA: HAMP domain-containing sensor histidine kinase [Flavipsychrobacter sp.]|nr:HAMP domain-containing sensor histidine kinase [Flavipsychrobacter sp.]